MPRGHNVSTYHFRVYDKEHKKNYYFLECSHIKKELGIPKSSVYKMIANKYHTMKKWTQYEVYSIKEPLYQRTQIIYE